MGAALRTLFDHVEKTWPVEDQEELVAIAREIESRRSGFYDMTEDEEAAVLEGLVQGDRGQFASPERWLAARKRYGL